MITPRQSTYVVVTTDLAPRLIDLICFDVAEKITQEALSQGIVESCSVLLFLNDEVCVFVPRYLAEECVHLDVGQRVV